MAKRTEPINPFYVSLVVVGMAFTVTACAYGLMSLRAIGAQPAGNDGPHPLMAYLDRHGRELMAGEVVLLAICAFAAMGLDRLRQRRHDNLDARQPGFESHPPDDRH